MDFKFVAIGVVLIIVILLVLISAIIIIVRSMGLLDPEPPTTEEMLIRPEIWGDREDIGSCTGYRIPPLNDTTPSNVSYTDVEGLEPIPGGFTPCLWPDEINQQTVEETCLSELCTDSYGNVLSRGDTTTFVSRCDVSDRCIGQLGVVTIGTGTPETDENAGYVCIASPSVGLLDTESCSLYDQSQFIILQPRSDNDNYIVRLYQRLYPSYTLSMRIGSSADQVIFEPISDVANNGNVWMIIPQMTDVIDDVTYISPSQIGYIGNIPYSIVTDPNNYISQASIRSFLLLYNVNTITYQDGSLILQPWKFEPNINTGNVITYDSHSSSFVTTNRMNDIPNYLNIIGVAG